jgi:hypothetical protein
MWITVDVCFRNWRLVPPTFSTSHQDDQRDLFDEEFGDDGDEEGDVRQGSSGGNCQLLSGSKQVYEGRSEGDSRWQNVDLTRRSHF